MIENVNYFSKVYVLLNNLFGKQYTIEMNPLTLIDVTRNLFYLHVCSDKITKE